MAQHDYNIANQGFPAFRTDLNNALSAIQTTNSGTSRPTGAVAGQLWLDTTSATTPTLKYYDGADDISLATIDHVGNTVNWLDSTVSITGLTTTATGTVLTLSDSASTSTVNLIIDNQKEIRFRETTANGTNYVALKAPASLSADLTFTLPSADGTSGQVLQTNGSGVLSFATVGGLAWQSVQTTGFTAVASRGYPCNTTSSAFTVTLPATPSVGDTIVLVDYAGTFATNNITLGANSNKINGVVTNKILTTAREAVTLTYVDSTQGWVSTSASNYGTTSIDTAPYSIDFLVVAGGGSGGRANTGGDCAGGGGAGGFRTSTQTVSGGTVITVTVGDGGAAVTTAATIGNAGSDSSISGSGLTTITSAGGGAGGRTLAGNNGGNGGSGGGSGGGGFNMLGGNGNTPSTSPSQGNNGGNGLTSGPSDSPSAGGGGASAAGANAQAAISGNGGAGTASSITGSSVTRAGGGGGCASFSGSPSGTAGSGGTGGGGAGSTTSGNGTDGTANTGGGGGGSNSATSGAGGKGVVILSMPDASYSGTTTGSPTVATGVSGKTVLTFNGSGSYTT
jgi:hypothetical protein